MRGRRALLLLAGAAAAAPLAACNIVNPPYVEPRRFPLEPRRQGPPRASTGRTLLLRTVRAAAGLETRSLRRVRADGTVDLTFYESWIAPPADLAEAALRAWLTSSGLFAALTAPGSRLTAPLVLETELTALEARLAEGRARAGLSGLLLAQPDGQDPRPLAQFLAEGFAPMAANAGSEEQARAMEAAMGVAFREVESRLADAAAGLAPAPRRSGRAGQGGA